MREYQSLLLLGLVSAAGLAARLTAVLAPAQFAQAIASFMGVSLYVAVVVLLGVGLAIALML